MILALDPGKASGWATFSNDGQFISMGQTSTIDDFITWLDNFVGDVTTVVVEDYVLYKQRALSQSGSKMPAPQIIGAILLFAKQKGANVVKQPAGILNIAQKLSGVPLPVDHSISHQFSAYNHGYYWLVKNGIRKAVAAEIVEGKNGKAADTQA